MQTFLNNHPISLILFMAGILLLCAIFARPIAKYALTSESKNLLTKYPMAVMSGTIILIIAGFVIIIVSLSSANTKLVNHKYNELKAQYTQLDHKIDQNEKKLTWLKAKSNVYTLKQDLPQLKQITDKINQVKSQNYHYEDQQTNLELKYWKYKAKIPFLNSNNTRDTLDSFD